MRLRQKWIIDLIGYLYNNYYYIISWLIFFYFFLIGVGSNWGAMRERGSHYSHWLWLSSFNHTSRLFTDLDTLRRLIKCIPMKNSRLVWLASPIKFQTLQYVNLSSLGCALGNWERWFGPTLHQKENKIKKANNLVHLYCQCMWLADDLVTWFIKPSIWSTAWGKSPKRSQDPFGKRIRQRF